MRLMTLTLFLAGALSCVSRNNHELVLLQLDATRAALSSNQAQCRSDERDHAARFAELEAEIHDRQQQLDAMADWHDDHEVSLVRLRAEYAELLSIASTPAEPPPPEKPRRPKKPPVDECPTVDLDPRIQASVDRMIDALAHEAEARFAGNRVQERHRQVEDEFEELVGEGWLTVEQRGDASVIVFPIRKLFQEGRSSFSPRGEDILTRSAEALGHLHGRSMDIQGHTDNNAFHSAEYASNWELGFGRAVAVMRVLRDKGVDQPGHASSWADTMPIGDNATKEGRVENRRVEIWLTEIPDLEHKFDPKDEGS